MDDEKLTANDSRIPLGLTKPQGKARVVKRASPEVLARMEAIDAEYRNRIRIEKEQTKAKLASGGVSKEAKKEIKEDQRLALEKLRHESLYAQAKAYADFTDEELPYGISDKALRIVIRRAYLPQYTRGEERFSGIAHFAGAGIALVLLILGVVFAAISQNPDIVAKRGIAVTSMAVFGIGAIILYTISGIYHFLYVNEAKRVLRIIDHSTVYILIASSYTPFCLLGTLDGSYGNASFPWGLLLLGIEWGLGILLIVCNCLWINNHAVLGISIAGYIVLGWGVVAFAPWVLQNLTLGGFLLLVIGGVVYTLGAILFGMGPKIRYLHGVAHILYIVGTLLHFFAILFYIIL